AIVTVYGLNEKIGNITYYDSSGQSEYNFTKPYSERTAENIDEEISLIIEEQYQRAIEILKEHREELTELAEELLEKEVIFKESLERIFGTPAYEIERRKREDELLNDSKDQNEEAKETMNGEEKTTQDEEEDTDTNLKEEE